MDTPHRREHARLMRQALNRALIALRLKKRPPVQRNRADVLQSVPFRNPKVKWETDERGEVSLIIPADQKRLFRILIRLMDLPKTRVVLLDKVGSFVWQECDGEQTFEQISRRLSERFRMTRRESETSLAAFFRNLGKRGILAFAAPKVAEDAIQSAKRGKAGKSG